MANRRNFMQTVGLGTLGALSKPAIAFGRVKLIAPVKTQITKYEPRTLEHGSDYVLDFTITDTEGKVVQMNTFSQRIDGEDWYSQLVAGVASCEGEVCLRINQLVTGKKGTVSGDVRYDDMEITVMQPDGTITRTSRPATAVTLTKPTAGLSMDQTMALLMKYHEQTWTTGNKKELVQFLRDRG